MTKKCLHEHTVIGPLGVWGSSHCMTIVEEDRGRTCTFLGALPGSIIIKYKFINMINKQIQIKK